MEREQETVVGIFHHGDRRNYVTPIDEKVAMEIIIPRAWSIPKRRMKRKPAEDDRDLRGPDHSGSARCMSGCPSRGCPIRSSHLGGKAGPQPGPSPLRIRVGDQQSSLARTSRSPKASSRSRRMKPNASNPGMIWKTWWSKLPSSSGLPRPRARADASRKFSAMKMISALTWR